MTHFSLMHLTNRLRLVKKRQNLHLLALHEVVYDYFSIMSSPRKIALSLQVGKVFLGCDKFLPDLSSLRPQFPPQPDPRQGRNSLSPTEKSHETRIDQSCMAAAHSSRDQKEQTIHTLLHLAYEASNVVGVSCLCGP